MENEMRDALLRMSQKRTGVSEARDLLAKFRQSFPAISSRLDMQKYRKLTPEQQHNSMNPALSAPYNFQRILAEELAAFDEVIGLQNLADKAAFDPEKFLDEIHKTENE